MKKLLAQSAYAVPLLGAALFASAMLIGVIALRLAKKRTADVAGTTKRPTGTRASSWAVHPLAVAEAFVSIISGVLLWIGIWDLLDEYVVPEKWWAKAALVLVGGLALYSTRALHDEQQFAEPSAQELTPAVQRSRGPVRAESSEGLELGAVSTSQTAHSGGGWPWSAMLATSRDPTPPMTPKGRAAHDVYSDMELLTITSAVGPPPTPYVRRPSLRSQQTQLAGLYFNRPRFSCGKCSRALFAICAGLVLWVGLWDLIDYHLLQALFPFCEVRSLGCAGVKFCLFLLGALGLYCTRSLYGDEVAPEFAQVQFTRIR